MTAATLVDHKIPIRVRPDLRLSYENLESQCDPCHGEKTEEDRRRYPEAYGGVHDL